MNGFKILDVLGEGAYSTVYKVMRLADERVFALKQIQFSGMSERDQKNAVAELRVYCSVNHPNVLKLETCWFEFDELCLILEWADAGDVKQLIDKTKESRKQIAESEIWRIFIQAAGGLGELHRLGIAHRDIKPANIFLFKDGQVKIADFNVSKARRKKNEMLTTQTGTPLYASPEVWDNQQYSFAADVWSLGCVVHEMATLSPPFDGQSLDNLYEAVQQAYPKPLKSPYSERLGPILHKMLKKDPLQRVNCQRLLCLVSVRKICREVFGSTKIVDNTPASDSYLRKTIKLPIKIANLAKITESISAELRMKANTRARESSIDDDRITGSAVMKSKSLPMLAKMTRKTPLLKVPTPSQANTLASNPRSPSVLHASVVLPSSSDSRGPSSRLEHSKHSILQNLSAIHELERFSLARIGSSVINLGSSHSQVKERILGLKSSQIEHKVANY